MGHNIKFPTECFSDMYDDTPLRAKIAEQIKTHGLEARQPSLFSRDIWDDLFVIDKDVSRGTIIGATLMSAWGFTKRSFQCDPALIDQITTTDLGSIGEYTDVLFDLKGCHYFEGRGCWLSALDVQGYWMSVQNNGDGSGSVLWLLNTTTAMIPVELPFDNEGIYKALTNYSEIAEKIAVDELGLGGNGSYSDPGMFWIGSVMSEIKLMYYLLSENAEVRKIGSNEDVGYQLNRNSELIVPDKMTQFVVGESVGAKIKSSNTIKNAHWVVNDDGSFSWLCGADSQTFDYRHAAYCTSVQTDEELVSINQGRSEDRFTAILTKEESQAVDNNISDEELRGRVIERIHQARRRVAEKNGTTYCREAAAREVEAEREKRRNEPLSDLAQRALAVSKQKRDEKAQREAMTGEIESVPLHH